MNKAVMPSELSQTHSRLSLNDAIDVHVRSSSLDPAHLAMTHVPLKLTGTLAQWSSLSLRVTPAIRKAFEKVQRDVTVLANEGSLDEDDLLVFLDEAHQIPNFMPTLETLIRNKAGDAGRMASPLGGKSLFLRDDLFSIALLEDFREIYGSKRGGNGCFKPATQAAFDKAMKRLVDRHRGDTAPLFRLLYSEWVYNRVFGAFLIRMQSPDLIETLLNPMFDAEARAVLHQQEIKLRDITAYNASRDKAPEAANAMAEGRSDLRTIAERVKHARTVAGISQIRVAEAASVSRPMVSWWENGRSKPSDAAIDVMADLFKTSAEWLKNGGAPPKVAENRSNGMDRRTNTNRKKKIPNAISSGQNPTSRRGKVEQNPETNEWDTVLPTHAETPPEAATEASAPGASAPAAPADLDASGSAGLRLSLAARTLCETWNNSLSMLIERTTAAQAGDAGIRDPEAFLLSLDELRTALMGTSALYAAAIRPVDVGHILVEAANVVMESAEIFEKEELVDVPASGTAHPDDVAAIEAEVASARNETLKLVSHLAASKQATDEANWLVLSKQVPARERAASEAALAIRHAALALDAIRRALIFVTPTVLAPAPSDSNAPSMAMK